MGDKGDLEFNSISFEKKLTSLKDSQESINTCCQWCLANRQYHKKIVSSWLNVLKRVKIEQRLILFYLANDVIQYSKKKNYEFVGSWGTTLQKATTMVRDEKIKHKILRIFKIWEQRAVYGEEFIADLCGLISASPSGKKGDETHEFQSSYLIQKIKLCAQLEVDTDLKLRELKDHNPKIQIDGDLLIASLKDRAHVDDVEKELDDYNKQMENYINALKLEIKARIHLISLLTQAEKALDNDKKDVKTVTSAYKAFATRVKTLKKKLDEKIPTLSSPLPSPDVDAPSPGPDSDIELPISDNTTPNSAADPISEPTFLPRPVDLNMLKLGAAEVFVDAAALYTNAGYYNPVPPPAAGTDSNTHLNHQFSTFIGSDLSFTLQNLRKSFHEDQTQSQNTNPSSRTQTTNSYNINDTISSLFPSMAFPPPPPALKSPTSTTNLQYANSGHLPLQPPPMPPFNKNNEMYGVPQFPETFNGSNANQMPPPPYHPPSPNYQVPPLPISSPFNSTNTTANYQPPVPELFSTTEEYNPEEELETWAPEPTWDALPPVEMDTPESPPMYEKAGYSDPIEYREGIAMGNVEDVDHRILPGDDILSRTGDVDHRNLISLTDSPSNQDQDYRNMSSPSKPIRNNIDQDYRTSFDIENFKLPPPPPPPPKMPPGEMMNAVNAFNTYTHLPLPNQFGDYMNCQNPTPHMLPKSFEKGHGFSEESRDFSEKQKLNDRSLNISLNESDCDVYMLNNSDTEMEDSNEKNSLPDNNCFELPPPFPDLLDDVDANQFLDNVRDDLEGFDTEDLDDFDQLPVLSSNSSGGYDGPPIFPPNYANPPNPNLLNQEMLHAPPWMGMPMPNLLPNQFEFQNFQNHAGIMPGNFNNRGMDRGRGMWGNRGFNDFRGYGRRGIRGNRRPRGSRGRGDRGRFDFRGNFRDNF